MRAKLSSYALVGIDAVPVDVMMEGDQVKVFDPDSRRVLHSDRMLNRTLPEGSVPEYAVNGRTLSQGRSAPAYLNATPYGDD